MLGSCSIALGYEVDPESGAACEDAVDNDVDGSTDCADADCWGDERCDEDFREGDRVVLCSDGVDNDEDGLADDFDPACWRTAPLERRRCASTRGTSIQAVEPLEWSGALRSVDDPEGRVVFEVPNGAPGARLNRPLTGRRRGSRFGVRARLGGADQLTLVVEPVLSDQPIPGVVQVGLVADRARASAFLRVAAPSIGFEEGNAVFAPLDGPLVQWTDVEVQFSEDTSGALHLVVDGAVEETLVLPTAFELEDDAQFEVRLESGGDALSPGGLVSAFWVERPRHDPCDGIDREPVPVPALDVDHEVNVFALAASDAVYCLLVERSDDGRVESMFADRDASNEPSTTWPALPRFASPRLWNVRGIPNPLSSPVIDWDPVRRVFRGAAVVRQDESVTGEVALVESAACDDLWTAVGTLEAVRTTYAFSGSSGGVVGYDVDEVTGAHHAFVVDRVGETGSEAFLELVSPCGEPGTFVRTGSISPRTMVERRRRPRAAILPIEGERLAIGLIGGAGALWGDASQTSNPLEPLVGPSGRAGRFDAAWIEHGTLWMPPLASREGQEWWGLIAYVARECETCPRRLGFMQFLPAGEVTVDVTRSSRRARRNDCPPP